MEYRLNSGHKIPVVGLGTWELTDREELLNALEYAYEAGYRHIDTAYIYRNESIIGEFLKTKNREEMFITTKLWNTDHGRVKEACAESMDRLGVDYLDLYLIHWPVSQGSEFNLRKVWSDMEELVISGRVRSIGVANFGLLNLNKLLDFCRIKPAANQIEVHPYLPQEEIRDYCTRNDIRVISYCSLGSSAKQNSIRDDPVIAQVAKEHSVAPTKVLLSYCVKLGCCIIPRSRSKAHIADNFDLVELTDDDLKAIQSIKKVVRYVEAESFGPHRFD